MASLQATFEGAIATIDQALALESRWKAAGRNDDDSLEEILRLYSQSVRKLDDTIGDGSLSETETAKLSAKRAEVAGRMESLELQRGPTLRSGSGNAYKDAVATLKEAAAMDARAEKGEPGLLVDTVRLYSHAIRLMLRGAQDPSCKQEVQKAIEQKIVGAKKRIAVLSTKTGDGLGLRAALDRDAAKFPELVAAEPKPEAQAVKPLSLRAVSTQGPRWCKRCKAVFEGSACGKGHPNYLYSQKLPAEAEAMPTRDHLGPTPSQPAAELARAKVSPRWDRKVEEDASSPTTNEAQNFLQEQARLQKIKAAEAKMKRAEKRLQRLSSKPSDDPSVAAAQRQVALASIELEAVQDSGLSPAPGRAESPTTPEQLEMQVDVGTTQVEPVEAEAAATAAMAEEEIDTQEAKEAAAAEAQAIAALTRKRLAAKKAEKEAQAAALADLQTATEAEAMSKTIVPMVDIGMIRAVNPDVKISKTKVAGVRAAIKKGDVEVELDGTLQVARSGDVADLSGDAKARAVAELRRTRKDPRIQERLRAAKARAEEDAQAVAAERAERERQALAEVAAAREKAAELLRAEAASAQAKKEEARKVQQEKAKAKAARAAEAAAAAKEQEDRARELAREQHAREAAAAAATRKPLLPASTVALPEPSAASTPAMHLRSDSLAAAGLSPDALLAADVPRIGLRQAPLPLAELAAQPPPRQYLRDAVGPPVIASLVRLARSSTSTAVSNHNAINTAASTPEKEVTTFLSRLLLSPAGLHAGLEDPQAEAEAASQLSASGVHGGNWRSTVRPLLEKALAQLDLERPLDRTEAIEVVARTLRSMDT